MSIFSYAVNSRDDAHVLKTRTKKGDWQDFGEKIPDALMLGVIDFVENDCFEYFVHDDDDMLMRFPQLIAYKNQSNLGRLFWPIKIDDFTREFVGKKWLERQISYQAKTTREIERHPYQKIISAYLFAKYRYLTFDALEEAGVMDFYHDELASDLYNVPDSLGKREAFDRATKLEEQFFKDVSKYCNILIRYRQYLWN